MPEVSIILPTLNEYQNITTLLGMLDAIEGDIEIVLVDDASTDGTPEAAETYNGKHSVRVIRRPKKMGLATAVIRGLSEARGTYCIVMDADLSHDTAILPAMLIQLRAGVDVVIGSRYIEEGGVIGWPLRRQMMSTFATWVAKILLNVKEKDPMSGYFGLRREVFERVHSRLRPRGYKILLEILVRARPLTTREIGFVFHDREHGKSKISGTIATEYGRMLMELFFRRR
ncbi:MAG: polyprenol monophosphomannose synthase [Patescibacteria group bacterium]|jgi:dolichol-phosphate mannosyltransferase